MEGQIANNGGILGVVMLGDGLFTFSQLDNAALDGSCAASARQCLRFGKVSSDVIENSAIFGAKSELLI